MTNDVECLFTCSFTICIFYLVRYLLRSFTHFLIQLFNLLFLIFKRYLYILDTNAVSYMCFANISSNSVTLLKKIFFLIYLSYF